MICYFRTFDFKVAYNGNLLITNTLTPISYFINADACYTVKACWNGPNNVGPTSCNNFQIMFCVVSFANTLTHQVTTGINLIGLSKHLKNKQLNHEEDDDDKEAAEEEALAAEEEALAAEEEALAAEEEDLAKRKFLGSCWRTMF